MGLLDGLLGDSWEDPKSQAIMGLAQGLLSARGSQGLSAGVGRMNEVMAGAKEKALRERLLGMQVSNYESEIEQRKAATAKAAAEMADQTLAGQTAQRFFQPGRPAMGAVGSMDAQLPPELRTGMQMPAQPEQAPQFDMRGYAAARMTQNPRDGLALMQSLQKELPMDKIDPKAFTPASLAKFAQSRNYGDLMPRDKLEFVEGVGVNPYDPRNANRAIPNPNKPFSMGADGQVVPNTPYQNYEINKAKAGAASTSVKVENKMGESLAGQVGPMVKDTYTAAQGAVQQIDAAQRIVQAVDAGKIIAGPFSGGRLKAAQLGQMLGITGKDDAEVIARSREVIRGLSEMTLQGRKQMTGQGAITESEGKLAEKANSGDPESLTPAEIKQLAKASARAAKFTYEIHTDNLRNLQTDPNTAGLAKFYKVRPLSSFDFGEQPAATPGGAKFLGFE